jgi:predicted transcriptional regulator
MRGYLPKRLSPHNQRLKVITENRPSSITSTAKNSINSRGNSRKLLHTIKQVNKVQFVQDDKQSHITNPRNQCVLWKFGNKVQQKDKPI